MKLLKTIVAVMAVIVTVSCTGSKKQSIMKREEAKKILVVVDLQRDFIDGTLPAADGASIIPSIEGIKNDFDMVYFTLDWHPWNHCSFKDNGGIWPQHCVQYTIGAGLPDGILDNLDPANTRFLPKGSDRSQEEYGQFSRTVATDQNFFVKGDKVVICGIAAEYCVLETLKNLVRLSNEIGFEISVFLDGVAHIENNTPLEEYMKQNDIKVYK